MESRDDINKDIVKMLKEQLDFARAQLVEKDQQIKSLQELVARLGQMQATNAMSPTPLSHSALLNTSGTILQANTPSASLLTPNNLVAPSPVNVNSPVVVSPSPRPPPGFESNKTKLNKNNKSYSFETNNDGDRAQLSAPSSSSSSSSSANRPSMRASASFATGNVNGHNVASPLSHSAALPLGSNSAASMSLRASMKELDVKSTSSPGGASNSTGGSNTPSNANNNKTPYFHLPDMLDDTSNDPFGMPPVGTDHSSSRGLLGLPLMDASNNTSLATFRALRNVDFDDATSPTGANNLNSSQQRSLRNSSTTNTTSAASSLLSTAASNNSNSNNINNSSSSSTSSTTSSPAPNSASSPTGVDFDELNRLDPKNDRRLLRKSVSHYLPQQPPSQGQRSMWDADAIERALRASEDNSRSSSAAGGSSQGGQNVGNPGRVLKKSQSLNSVSSATADENRIDMKFPELEQMVGQIYALSKYQQGCRFLQKKLEEKNASNTQIIFDELHDHLVELMTDPFGNYLFTKLIEHCDEAQKDRAIQRILPELLTVAVDMYGTQSLQKIMPFLESAQITAIINTLKTNTIPLVKHSKANYLVQYFLDNLSPAYTLWVYESVVEHLEDVSRDRVGCVIVKKCIDHATDEQKRKLVGEVISRALALVQDPFGNYVVQHILLKVPGESGNLILALLGHLTDLCVQKFSSNVVEKCLQVAPVDLKHRMLVEIMNSEMLPQLLNDRFANFVIQTALDVADADEHKDLVQRILPHLGKHYSPYSKHLQKKILKV